MADSNTIIAATIQVDTGTSNQNVTALNKSLGETKTALKDTGATVQAAGKNFAEAGGNFKNLREQAAAIPGPLGATSDGVTKLNGVLKVLAANPVVAVLTLLAGVLALLYKAFTNTFAGAQKVEQVFAGIKAAAQALFDNIGHLASALVKFFTFDFSGAVDEIKQVVGAVTDAYTAMSKLTEQAQKLHQEQLKNDLEQADRAKQLAILREKATDADVSPKERKEALLELQKLAQENAVQDVKLAREKRDNTIAQLTLEKDGALKNQDEINKAKIEAIQVETENANELRRIGKQLTQANKQELAEQAANEKAAADEAKKRAQDLYDFKIKLLKLQQDNTLLTIKDGFDKEATALAQKNDNERAANIKSFQDKKITRDQLNQLNQALDIKYNLEQDALSEKHNQEVEKKEEDFQKELASITLKTRIDGIRDVREAELAQLEIGYNEKLQQAIERYAGDGEKLKAIRLALEEQFHAEQQKLKAKFQQEDNKKIFELEEKRQQKIADNRHADFDDRVAAVDAEQSLIQQAFDNKVISEIEYNSKVAGLADARKQIREDERDHALKVATGLGDAFNTLAELAGKQTALGKGLAIASTTIKTFQGAIAAFTGMVDTIPGPVGIALGVVAAAGAVAAGIAAVKKIVAVQIPGQGSGGGSVPTALPAQSAPIAPTQSGTKLDASSISAINNPANGGVNRPFQAFVVESDNAAAVNRAARLQGASVLGGH